MKLEVGQLYERQCRLGHVIILAVEDSVVTFLWMNTREDRMYVKRESINDVNDDVGWELLA